MWFSRIVKILSLLLACFLTTIPNSHRDSVKRCQMEWNNPVLYVTLCKDLTFNECYCERHGKNFVLWFCKAHCAVKVCAEHSIQIFERCRLKWTKCNGVFSSLQSENSRGSWTQPHWPGWIKEKGRRWDRKKGKKGREQKIGSVSFIQHFNLSRWIALVALRGPFLFFFCSMQSIPTI